MAKLSSPLSQRMSRLSADRTGEVWEDFWRGEEETLQHSSMPTLLFFHGDTVIKPLRELITRTTQWSQSAMNDPERRSRTSINQTEHTHTHTHLVYYLFPRTLHKEILANYIPLHLPYLITENFIHFYIPKKTFPACLL